MDLSMKIHTCRAILNLLCLNLLLEISKIYPEFESLFVGAHTVLQEICYAFYNRYTSV